jgi:hypothetical protein
MQKLLVVTFIALFWAASLVGCVPITATGNGAAQQLNQAAIQQTHDRLVDATGAYGASERVVEFQN